MDFLDFLNPRSSNAKDASREVCHSRFIFFEYIDFQNANVYVFQALVSLATKADLEFMRERIMDDIIEHMAVASNRHIHGKA